MIISLIWRDLFPYPIFCHSFEGILNKIYIDISNGQKFELLHSTMCWLQIECIDYQSSGGIWSKFRTKIAINYFKQMFYYRSAQWSMSTPRTILIVTMSMCYGMELTYKLATKQLIFIINPCHVMCLLQLTVLCLNPFSSGAQHLFRIMLNGMFFPLWCESCHFDRASNDEFSVEFWMYVFLFFQLT